MSFELKTQNYIFKPRLITTLLALICIPTLVSLGFWQLDRADEKRVIDQGVNNAISKPALSFNQQSLETLDEEIFRTAAINGHYDLEKQYLLDNRTHKGLPGYHVISPFIFERQVSDITSTHAVLVNRGWISYQGTRNKIPDISLDKGTNRITGTIKHIPRAILLKDKASNDSSEAMVFKADNKQLTGVKLIQSIQLDELESKLSYELLPVIIELDKTIEEGFTREWQPYYGSIDKHNAYALQWFAMASIVLFLFFKLNIRKR